MLTLYLLSGLAFWFLAMGSCKATDLERLAIIYPTEKDWLEGNVGFMLTNLIFFLLLSALPYILLIAFYGMKPHRWKNPFSTKSANE